MQLSRVNKLFLSLVLAAFFATVAQADSTFLAPGNGYRADDYLTGVSFEAFSMVDSDSALLCKAGTGLKVVNLYTGQTEVDLGQVPEDYTSANINPNDQDLYLWASFVEKNPADGSYWVGFTNDGDDDDRIYQVSPGGAWAQRATLKCNFDAKFSGNDLLVSANPGGTAATLNQIVLLDTSGVNDHTVLVDIGGYSSGLGLAVNGSGDVYYTTYFGYETSNNLLLHFTGTQLQNASTTGTPCEMEDAEVLYGSSEQILYGAYDTEVDAAGHVVFNGNVAYATPGNHIRLWDAAKPGELVDVATCTGGDWLTQLDAEGDLLSAGGSVYATAWQRGITKITKLIPGDANGDGTVDGSDATILAAHWQESGASWSDGDFNGDGDVDGSDATLLAAHWQESLATMSPTAVPEPSMVVLLAVLGLVGLIRKFS